MHTSTKKTLIPYGRPKLTVVRNLSRVNSSREDKENQEEDNKERRNDNDRWLMPEQPSGYIKSRKHDCL
jgi:hypothetical protein